MTDDGLPQVSHLALTYRARLAPTPVYRPDLDLSIRDASGDAATWGLFRLDPATCLGQIEPMMLSVSAASSSSVQESPNDQRSPRDCFGGVT